MIDPHFVEGDSFESDADEFTFELVLDDDGRPRCGPEVIRIDHVEPARHSKFGAGGDVRVLARCTAIRTGQTVLKVWCLTCGGCRRRAGARCTKPRLKPGVSGYLRRDAQIALGRRIKPRERLSFHATFGGRIFRAEVRPVDHDEDGNLLPPALAYTVVGPFVYDPDLTPTLTLSESITPTPTYTRIRINTATSITGARVNDASESGESPRGSQNDGEENE